MSLVENKDILTVIMPVYNEANSVGLVLEKILANQWVGQIIVVDDASTDNSWAIITAWQQKHPAKIDLIKNTKNQGKGASIRQAQNKIKMPFVIIQDADFEYDPSEYGKLLQPLIVENYDVCIGSRYLAVNPRAALKFWHTMGNKLLTTFSNIITNLYLTDMETCYKAFNSKIFKSIKLQESRFGIEPELVAKVAKKRLKVIEVPISYRPRTYAEGKHIGIKDAFRAIWCVVKYTLIK